MEEAILGKKKKDSEAETCEFLELVRSLNFAWLHCSFRDECAAI